MIEDSEAHIEDAREEFSNKARLICCFLGFELTRMNVG